MEKRMVVEYGFVGGFEIPHYFYSFGLPPKLIDCKNKPQMKPSSILAIASMIASTASLQGALVIYEPFTDPETTLNGNTAGTTPDGLSGNWAATGTHNVTAGSLAWGSLATSGNKAVSGSGTSASAAITAGALTTPGLLNDGATLWFSLIYRTAPTVSGNPDAGFALATDAMGSGNNVPIGALGSGIGFTIKSGVMSASTWVGGAVGRATTTVASEPVAGSTTYFIVGEMIWGADGAAVDTINLYRPNTSLVLGSVLATRSVVLNQSAFDTLTFANKGDVGAFPITVDEIRFGDSYASVSPVPEPAAALLGAIGSLILLRRRR